MTVFGQTEEADGSLLYITIYSSYYFSLWRYVIAVMSAQRGGEFRLFEIPFETSARYTLHLEQTGIPQ